MERIEELAEQSVAKWGNLNQMDMVVEECSELIQAVCKIKRLSPNANINEEVKRFDNLYEEIADVEIMLAQLKHMFACHGEVKRNIDKKLDRLEQRLNK